MSRPRKSYEWLPKYFRCHHGTIWFHPPDGSPRIRIGPEDQEHLVWRFMLDFKQEEPAKEGTLRYYFERYKREVLPSLQPRTQKDYSRHLALLAKRFGHMHPDEVKPKHIGQFLDREKGKIQATARPPCSQRFTPRWWGDGMWPRGTLVLGSSATPRSAGRATSRTPSIRRCT